MESRHRGALLRPGGNDIAHRRSALFRTTGECVGIAELHFARRQRGAGMSGTVEAIYVAERSGQPMRAIDQVVGTAGRGLLGDRHCRAADAPPLAPADRVPDISLVEAEVLDS